MIKELYPTEQVNKERKLSELVSLCLETHNYEKLAHIAKEYIIKEVMRLISYTEGVNKINKRLEWSQVVPSIHRINLLFSNRFNTKLIPKKIVSTLTNFNVLSKKSRSIGPPVLKLAFRTYYELKKIKVPNLCNDSSLNLSNLVKTTAPKFSLTNDLMVYELRNKKKTLKYQLNQNYDPAIIEQILHIEKWEHNKQINDYKTNTPEFILLRFFLLGAMFISISLTGLLFYERVIFSEVNAPLSLLSIVFILLSVSISLVYYKFFHIRFRRR